jgi:hypothetical protein
VSPLEGTSLGNKLVGLGTREQFKRTLFEKENPSLENATAIVPTSSTGDTHVARASDRTTAETNAEPEKPRRLNRHVLWLLRIKFEPEIVMSVPTSEFKTSGVTL